MWNEPNWYTWISPHKNAPLLYRKLYQAGYKAAKTANPNAEVVLGELAPHFQNGDLDAAAPVHPRDGLREQEAEARSRARTRSAGASRSSSTRSSHPSVRLRAQADVSASNPDELTIANVDDAVDLLGKLRKKGLIKTKKKKFPIYLTEHGYMVADNPDVQPRSGGSRKTEAREVDRAGVEDRAGVLRRSSRTCTSGSSRRRLGRRAGSSTWACSQRVARRASRTSRSAAGSRMRPPAERSRSRAPARRARA